MTRLPFSRYIVAAAWLTACGTEAQDVDVASELALTQAIVNGVPCGPTEFSATGVLSVNDGSRYGSSTCTATVIDARHVLTAAHCVSDDPRLQDYFSLALDVRDYGQHPLALPPPARHVVHWHRPIDAHFIGQYADLAIGELDAPIFEAAEVLPTPDVPLRLAAGTPVMIAGNGLRAIGPNGRLDNSLADIKYCGTTELHHISGNKLFLNDGPPFPTICHGDSGGPAFISVGSQKRLVGVVSSGGADCLTEPTYTQVAPYLDWIMQVLNP